MSESKRRQAGTYGPIEADQRDKMQAVARALDDVLNPAGEKKIGFVLLTARFGDIKDGRVNYIANGERADMLAMMHELLARMEGRHADETQSGAPERPQ